MIVYVKDILDLLADTGPATAADIANYFAGSDRRQVARVLSDLRRRKTKGVHIKAYTHTSDPDEKFYPRPIYALGDKPDAKKPPALTPTQLTDRYRKKARAQQRVPNSVWQLGACP